MSHIQKELISGFLFLKETEMEGIEEALFRYVRILMQIFYSLKQQRIKSCDPLNVKAVQLGMV